MSFADFTKKITNLLKEPEVLTEERNALVDANTKATETGVPQKVQINGEDLTVMDKDRAGREVIKNV